MKKFYDLQGKQLKINNRVAVYTRESGLTIGRIVKFGTVRVVVEYSGPISTKNVAPAKIHQVNFDTCKIIRLPS